MISVSVVDDECDGETGDGGGEGGCLRFTMAISQCGDDSLSHVTEGRTWRG